MFNIDVDVTSVYLVCLLPLGCNQWSMLGMQWAATGMVALDNQTKMQGVRISFISR